MTTTKLDFRSLECGVGFKHTPKNKLWTLQKRVQSSSLKTSNSAERTRILHERAIALKAGPTLLVTSVNPPLNWLLGPIFQSLIKLIPD